MPFTSVPKESLISVLSRNKSSAQSVICFLEGFYWLVREPILDCERRTKILCHPQGRLELNSGIWNDVHLLPPPLAKAADRPGNSTVKTNVYFEYNTYYFHPELTLYHLCLEGFFVRLKWFIKLNYLKRTVWLIWLCITLFKKGWTRARYSARSLIIFYQV